MDSTIIRCNLPRTDRTIELEGCYIVDQTGKMYVHILGSTAEHLLEIKADLFHQYQEDSDTTKYENILMQAAAKSRILKICSKAVEYNL
ncbi:unnamed protein product, partial [Rotaria socialis]